MAAPKGHNGQGGGRPPGSSNKVTLEFKEAVNNLINFATPRMVSWLGDIAAEDPNKALDHVFKFAQFGYPLIARSELTGLNGGAIETKDVTPADKELIARYLQSQKEKQ